jgi:hypothetical protein
VDAREVCVTWLTVLTSILAIAKSLASFLQERQIIDAATAQATLQGLQDATAAIQRANAARDLVRANHARDPSRVMQDDGFRRD